MVCNKHALIPHMFYHPPEQDGKGDEGPAEAAEEVEGST